MFLVHSILLLKYIYTKSLHSTLQNNNHVYRQNLLLIALRSISDVINHFPVSLPYGFRFCMPTINTYALQTCIIHTRAPNTAMSRREIGIMQCQRQNGMFTVLYARGEHLRYIVTRVQLLPRGPVSPI